MFIPRSASVLAAFLILLAASPAFPATNLTLKQKLGKDLFLDTNLSNPPGQSCSTCHHPQAGYADPRHALPDSQGVIPTRFGQRNAPTVTYASYNPEFHQDSASGEYIGGLIWDGTFKNLTTQAQRPFLHPLEMNNPSQAAVVKKVRHAAYYPLFVKVYGAEAVSNTAKAYVKIADAIASYESSSEFHPFTSKYDYYLAGKVQLTEAELAGLALFNGKGNCSSCHPSQGINGNPPLFTLCVYYNLGVPKNPENPFYSNSPTFNPEGANFVDLGLGAVLNDASQDGKFKTPTLRNVAVTWPYMHNGVFKTLNDAVQFHNSRDAEALWKATRYRLPRCLTTSKTISRETWGLQKRRLRR